MAADGSPFVASATTRSLDVDAGQLWVEGMRMIHPLALNNLKLSDAECVAQQMPKHLM
jgi:hypothetical protein